MRSAAIRNFSLSNHPTIATETLTNFFRHGLSQEATKSWKHLDALLNEAFKDILLIGELPITEDDFIAISEMIRREYIVNDVQKVKSVFPATFLTSMVFCARYSESNKREFWKPYAELVWGLDVATPDFQRRCREQFRDCIEDITNRFEHLTFDIDREGDVVRPVFQHAMIPFYLQDDFAGWFLQQYKKVLDLPRSSAVAELQTEEALRYVAPRLRRFISDTDTAKPAAHLIQQMIEAVQIFGDGETPEAISTMIVNPIEKALWEQIAEQLIEHDEYKAQERRPQPKLGWIWSLEDSSMKLRLSNVISRKKPDSCVWAHASEQNLLSAPVEERVYPWMRNDGQYFLDEVVLQGGPSDGRICVISTEYEGGSDEILFERSVPDLPTSSVIFFRITQQNAYGIPITEGDPRSPGEWLVSMAEGITLHTEDGSEITPRQRYTTPDLLKEHACHVISGQYPIVFPLIIKQNGNIIRTIKAGSGSEILHASIVGSNQLLGLSTRVPPAFSDTGVNLQVPAKLQQHNRITLTLESGVTLPRFGGR